MGRIAVVTGANQGLGFAEGLAQRMGREDVVHLTGRDSERALDAAATLEESVAEVRTRVLDVRDDASITDADTARVRTACASGRPRAGRGQRFRHAAQPACPVARPV
jgi:NAD(P)-dependent dehydrogenase (short-subunit alcohol dehydrogenase family)